MGATHCSFKNFLARAEHADHGITSIYKVLGSVCSNTHTHTHTHSCAYTGGRQAEAEIVSEIFMLGTLEDYLVI
jgi:hypothetical protein